MIASTTCEITIPQTFLFVAIESDVNNVSLYSLCLRILHYLVCYVYKISNAEIN